MREALRSLGLRSGPVLATPRGAPALPPGVRGSISHKDDLAAALASRDDGWEIGLDLETLEPARERIGRLVLTPEEASELAGLGAEDYWPALLARFSAKEALYKALDPFVERYVGFQEVLVRPRASGRVDVELRLNDAGPPLKAEAFWRRWQGYLITSARVRGS